MSGTEELTADLPASRKHRGSLDLHTFPHPAGLTPSTPAAPRSPQSTQKEAQDAAELNTNFISITRMLVVIIITIKLKEGDEGSDTWFLEQALELKPPS